MPTYRWFSVVLPCCECNEPVAAERVEECSRCFEYVCTRHQSKHERVCWLLGVPGEEDLDD